MHTSCVTLGLFWGAVAFAFGAQVLNYYSLDKNQRRGNRKLALGLGLIAIASGIAGWRASIDWATLPMSDEGLTKGQVWNNGGIPAIASTYGPNAGKGIVTVIRPGSGRGGG
jgi:hypothetical protein